MALVDNYSSSEEDLSDNEDKAVVAEEPREPKRMTNGATTAPPVDDDVESLLARRCRAATTSVPSRGRMCVPARGRAAQLPVPPQRGLSFMYFARLCIAPPRPRVLLQPLHKHLVL